MSRRNPKVGFVSLGCPKALVDSERILTQLRVEGYQLMAGHDDADVVVVNTCGFIDAAVAESLDAIGEAVAENGKVIVTGCLGKRADLITVSLNRPNAIPLYDVFSHLVYALKGSDVSDVMVNGKLLVEQRRVKQLDAEEILRRGASFGLRISRSVGK